MITAYGFLVCTDLGVTFGWSPLNFTSRPKRKQAAATQFKPLFIRHHPSIFIYRLRALNKVYSEPPGLKNGRFSLPGVMGRRTLEVKAC